MKHQAFIASYSRDFEWLEHCLFSLKKFGVGWLHPVVCVSSEDKAGAEYIAKYNYPEAIIVVKNGRPAQGFMRAQLGMMQADLYCPDADVIYFLGSDCIMFQECRPEQYCDDLGRPAVLYTPRDVLEREKSPAMPWLVGTDAVLMFSTPAEFMRRLPSVYPRSIFAPMRNYVAEAHAMPFEEFIYQHDGINKNVSEANILGSYAFRCTPDTCHWVNTETDDLKPWTTGILQMWSHGGLDRPMDADVTLPDGTRTLGQRPRDVIAKVLG